ncbi:MAG: SDR family oxidoreductase [Anaerolineales bacterium]|nr:SDR family oxidoreductase [Anaerolineales bacterium]
MMNKDILAGKWALVTGASSGLGVDFARILASRGTNLVLVARREEKLKSVKDTLVEAYRVDVRVIPFDLAGNGAAAGLYEEINSRGLDIDVLINNAGFGLYGPFLDGDLSSEQDMINLNVEALMSLTKLFLRDMQERGSGYVLQVASNGAYQPTPGYAVYSATKSFVLSFGEALNYELKDSPVSVTVVSPGPTTTEFHQVSGQGRDNLYLRLLTMESGRVAEIGINAMLKGKPSVVPGRLNAALAWISQRVPRRLAAAAAGWTMGI